MGKLWKQLLTTETITRGWHLARADTKRDFSEDLYSTDVYGQDLKHHVQETINRIRTDTYQPRPLFRMEVPKGPLAFRPGTVIPIHDRVVLSAIVLLIAPEVDEELLENVYSWRLKDPVPKKGPIFRETEITDLPFLKKSTIRAEVDPFEGWYRLWPEFDRATRHSFLDEDYRFLATSDIAAYFENIQLPILRDQLLRYLPKETRLVNLLFSFLEAWAEKTADGRPHYRGIPQGNFVSSFLGNVFLMPLDQAFQDFSDDHHIRYFRYMDDVRVFTKTREDARLAIFLMARTLRALHLNVQTAKTKIYDEHLGQISKLLIDSRVDQLSELIEEIQSLGHQALSDTQRSEYLRRLHIIARSDSPSGQKLVGARAPLEGLTSRCFSRWIYARCLLGSDNFVNRLLAEISRSADDRWTRKLLAAARQFPTKRAMETSIMAMVRDGKIIFPYQEAECLRSLRYLSSVRHDLIQHCWKRLFDRKASRYLRMESAYLLSRTDLSQSRIKNIVEHFDSEPDSYVQVAMAMLVVQRRHNNQEIVRRLVFHPNEKVRDIGKLFRTVKNDESYARECLRHAFRAEVPWMICDYMPLIHLMASSENRGVRQVLLDCIRQPRLQHPMTGIRKILRPMFTRTRESLRL